MTELYRAFIGGEWVAASDGAATSIINPATGQAVAQATRCGVPELNRAVQAADDAAPGWGATPVGERSKILLKASQLIMARQEELARLETAEHGSPIRKTMNFDVPLCAEQFDREFI